MAGLEEGLVSHLKNNAGVAALVGTRVHPLILPQQATQPALVYLIVSDDRPQSHSGPTGLARPRIQIDCWSATISTGGTYGQAKAIERAVRAALEGFIGTMGTVSVRGVTLDTAQDLFDEEGQRYRVRMDWFIAYR